MVEKDASGRATVSEWIGMNPSGITWHDLIVLEDPRYPDRDRAAVAQVITDRWYRRPIAPQRWNAISKSARDELNNRALVNGTTPQKEIARSAEDALFLAVEQAGGIFTEGPRLAFHRRINDLVVEDLLGPSWRDDREIDIGELGDVPDEQANQAEVEAAMELETRIIAAKLSAQEKEIVWAIFRGERSTEVAARLGKKPEAIRTSLNRARKKLQSTT